MRSLGGGLPAIHGLVVSSLLGRSLLAIACVALVFSLIGMMTLHFSKHAHLAYHGFHVAVLGMIVFAAALAGAMCLG
jgi:hypothetical protein